MDLETQDDQDASSRHAHARGNKYPGLQHGHVFNTDEAIARLRDKLAAVVAATAAVAATATA